MSTAELRGGAPAPSTVRARPTGFVHDVSTIAGRALRAVPRDLEGVVPVDRVVLQVGGGALAACVGAALGPGVRLDTVQAEGCAPLAAAWERAAVVEQPARYWSQVMRPWPDPHSVADGILDDETYDWIADLDVMVESGGEPIVALESGIVRAHELAVAAGYSVSPTGSAGLAGVLAAKVRGENVAIVMSGVAR